VETAALRSVVSCDPNESFNIKIKAELEVNRQKI
jgi:hypothetical protein